MDEWKHILLEMDDDAYDDDENDHDDNDDDDADQVERIEGDSGDTYGCQPSPGPAAEVKVHVIREGGPFMIIMIMIMMLIMIMMIWKYESSIIFGPSRGFDFYSAWQWPWGSPKIGHPIL